jgi:ABC-type hemin transport system ATPase subunit
MRLLRQWAGQQGAGVVAVIHDLNLACAMPTMCWYWR